MAETEPDIIRQLRADFGEDQFARKIAQLVEASGVPRIQRCIVFAARGHTWYFDYLCKLAKIDLRDVISAAEYDRLGAHLYDFNRPIENAMIADPYGDRLRNEHGPT
jgi:hypothetical protein